MGYLLGVDGGNTKTHYALFDHNGNMLSFIEGGSASHEALSDSYEGSYRELKRNLEMLCEKAGISIGEIDNAVFGLAGADTRKQHIQLAEVIKRIGVKKFVVCNDGYPGLKAGSETGYGICCNIGTGTCCVGINRQGDRLMIGGYGYYFGCDSGGNYLGGLALKAVYDSIYRCGTPTIMKDMIFEMTGVTNDDDFVEKFYDMGYPDLNMSMFSSIVFYAANQGDEVAIELLVDMGKRAASAVLGMEKKLDFGQDKEIIVVMSGSVFVKGENSSLINSFKNEVTRYMYRRPKFSLLDAPPVAGAVIWAFEGHYPLNGVTRNNILNDLKRVLEPK